MDVAFEYKPFAETIDSEYFDHDLEDKALGAVFIDVIRGHNISAPSSRVLAFVGNQRVELDNVAGKNPVYRQHICLKVKSFYSDKLEVHVSGLAICYNTDVALLVTAVRCSVKSDCARMRFWAR